MRSLPSHQRRRGGGDYREQVLFCRLPARIMLGTVAGVAALTLGGCGQDSPPDSPPGPLDGATISLMQYTHDQVNRVLVVTIEAGGRTVHVNRVEVVSGDRKSTRLNSSH